MRTIITALAAAIALSACAGGGGPDASEGAPRAGTSVAIGSDTAASCVEVYSVETVTNRSFAFDGTVVAVSGESGGPEASGYVDVTFEVHEWFRGGDRDEVTVQMMAPGVMTSVDNAEYEVGSRLLVAGEPRWGGEPLDAAVAWSCGFTRTHDAGTAAAWRDAFS